MGRTLPSEVRGVSPHGALQDDWISPPPGAVWVSSRGQYSRILSLFWSKFEEMAWFRGELAMALDAPGAQATLTKRGGRVTECRGAA